MQSVFPLSSQMSSHLPAPPKSTHTQKVVNYLVKVHDICDSVCIEAAVFSPGNTCSQHLTLEGT